MCCRRQNLNRYGLQAGRMLRVNAAFDSTPFRPCCWQAPPPEPVFLYTTSRLSSPASRSARPGTPCHPSGLRQQVPRPGSQHQARSSPHASRPTTCKQSLWECASSPQTCNRSHQASASASGRYGVKRCPRRFVPQLLRNRLTPRPPAEEAAISFGQSQNKFGNLLGLKSNSE